MYGDIEPIEKAEENKKLKGRKTIKFGHHEAEVPHGLC